MCRKGRAVSLMSVPDEAVNVCHVMKSRPLSACVSNILADEENAHGALGRIPGSTFVRANARVG